MIELKVSDDATDTRRQKRSWFRFGSRLLFLVMTVVAVTLAVITKRLHDRKTAINNIQDAGGTMGYSIGGPDWLRRIVRDEQCFYEPQRISLGPIAKGNPELDDDILASVSKSLKQFRDLQALDIRRSAITDESAPLLAQLASVTHLRLSDTQITDKTIKHIKQLPNLQSLLLANTCLTDNCVDDLCKIQTLADLDVRGTRLSQNAIVQLNDSLQACKISY